MTEPMQELADLFDALIDETMQSAKTIGAIRAFFLERMEEERQPAGAPAPEPEKKPLPTKEEVRKVLVAKSSADDGKYKPQVKALVRKYSATGNLSAVKPESYPALLAELEVMGDA